MIIDFQIQVRGVIFHKEIEHNRSEKTRIEENKKHLFEREFTSARQRRHHLEARQAQTLLKQRYQNGTKICSQAQSQKSSLCRFQESCL